MRLIIQKVKQAKVTIDGEIAGEIGPGLMVLLGIGKQDGPDDIDWLVGKMIRMRIFADDAGKMNRSVQDTDGGILLVSQFTLYADCKKGNRPSFIRSAPPETAIPLYEKFLTTLKAHFEGPVETGEFGAMMEVSLTNDGPVTIVLDSKQRDF